MGILDDAIREHLDLKRRHGARESELRDIEDQAFGSGDRPDPFAAGELLGRVAAPADTEPEEPTRVVEPEDRVVQPEAPPEPTGTPEPPTPAPPEPSMPPPEPPSPAAEPEESTPSSEPLVPPPGEAPSPPAPSGKSEPELPLESESLDELMAQEEESGPSASAATPEAPPPAAPVEPTEEAPPPPAPVEPTEEAPPPPSAPQPEESPSTAPEPQEPPPSPPKGGVPDPPPPPPETGEEPRGRARGRVNVPTQEFSPPDESAGDIAPPLEAEGEKGAAVEPAESVEAGESDSDAPQLYDFETDEDPVVSGAGQPAVDEEDDFEALGPVEEEAEYLEEEEPYAEEAGGVAELPAEDTEERELVVPDVHEEEEAPAPAPDEEDDILSGSPEFVEEDTEREGLWFEKGPPQDFEFEEEEDEK
jgi:hypothetical protein